jgi:hypothetical protein
MGADFGKKYGTSEKLENEGRIIKNEEDGSWLKIARFGNKAHAELTRELMRPHRAAARAGTLSDAVLQRVTIKAMAATILLDWGGYEDEGKPIAYTRENAELMLTKYKDFREDVSRLSRDMAIFQEEDEEAARKNSSSASAGTSDTAA